MKHFKFLSLMLMATVAMFAFTACGDDDEEGDAGKNNGQNNSGINTNDSTNNGSVQQNVTADQLIGTWYGVDENSSKKINVFVMDFEANGKGHYAEYKAKAEENWVTRDPQYAEMTWTLNNGTLNATVNIPNEGPVTRKGDILSLNANTVKVRRYLEDGYTDEMTMIRVNNANEFAQIFAQMILQKTGDRQEEGDTLSVGDNLLLGTWKTTRITGKATSIESGEVVEDWDNTPLFEDAKNGKESLKYMEFTFGQNGMFKLQQFNEETREFSDIMQGTWKQEGTTLSVDFGDDFVRSVNIVSLTENQLVINEKHIDEEFEVHGTDKKIKVEYEEVIYFSRK